MKKVLIVLATTIFFTSMNFLNATTISGKIIAKHISEKIIAHLLITNLIDSISTHIVEVKSDGSFTFELSETGFYEIHATAISSEQVKFLYFNERKRSQH